MTPRVRIALLAITALVLVTGALVGMTVAASASSGGISLVDPNESPAALIAVTVKSPLSALSRALPQAAVIGSVLATVRFSARRRSMRGLPFRLGDVGDRWRALLFGAPPSLL